MDSILSGGGGELKSDLGHLLTVRSKYKSHERIQLCPWLLR